MQEERHVFISYSSKELETATKVCAFLEENGIKCWIAPRNVEAGTNYPTQIVSAIKRCEVLVLLASENTNASGHVSNEVSIAFDNKKIIIPFKLQNFVFTDEYLYFLGRKHWIDAYEDIGSAMIKLRETILQLAPSFSGFAATVEEKPQAVIKNTNHKDNHNQSESRQSAVLTREQIVDIIVQKSLKYPYNIFSKIETDNERKAFLKDALLMFGETLKVYRHNKLVDDSDNVVDLIVDELANKKEMSIPVRGLPGSAKNMLLQLAFYQMLDNFKCGRSDALPFYISVSYYEKIPYNPCNVYEQMKDILYKEQSEYFDFVDNHSYVKPVLFIEAVREHNVAPISPENVVSDLWRKYGKFNRICAIDVGLIKNRSRLKRVIPILGDTKGYAFLSNQIPIDDKRSVCALIESVFSMYGYELEVNDVYDVLKSLQFPTTDIFLVRLVAKEMMSVYDYSEIRLTDIYEKLALSELLGDEKKLRAVSEELYSYIFDRNYSLDSKEYNAAMWSLPHKHNTYLEFLIAYYFVCRINDYKNFDEHEFFGTMLTAMSNRFMVSFLADNYALQETLLNFIKDNYNSFDIKQKSNAVYWLGRITYKNLVGEAAELLFDEFKRYKPVVKYNNSNTQENCDNQFLFRAICTGLLFFGRADIMDDYLCLLVTNDIANAINRGATIEYYGDNYQMVAHDAYYLDTDLNAGEQALKILNSRIELALAKNTNEFVEKNLVTVLTLLQARTERSGLKIRYDIKPFVKKAIGYIETYRTRPQNVASDKLIFYFESIKEDFQKYLSKESFDIGTIVYNQYRSLKQIKRSQWLSHSIDDPESVSEHSFGAWMMAMFFLPEECDMEGYSKKEILDMLLIHDMAEAALGDQETSLSETKKELKTQNEVLRKLFLKGTYPGMGNLTYYYNIWTGYYNGVNSNARTARDINLLQSVYTFFEYCRLFPEKFSSDDVKSWLLEKSNLKTSVGYNLFDRLITDNDDYRTIIEAARA